MYLKAKTGLLPGFQPYESLHIALDNLIGGRISPVVPWVISFLNGSTMLGFAFGRLYLRLPGGSGAAKGLMFGLAGWIVMGLIFFPLLGMGPFATALGLGVGPALFSLTMILAYSIVLGLVYAALK